MRKVEELIRIIVRTIVTIMLPTIVCSCQIGLGSQVDTEAPTLSISYPPVSAVIKDGFVIGGSWDDDQGVTKITVTVKNAAAASGTTGDSYTATINTTDKKWSLNLNAYDATAYASTNGWQYADGTYSVDVIAEDAAGHTSGTSSRSFSIDNTAPVLVLTKPTSVGSGTPKSYGRTVQLEGSFAEATESKIATLVVSFYDDTGKKLFDSSFADITDMSNANPLVIAEYYSLANTPAPTSADYQKWTNYKSLYGIASDTDDDATRNKGVTKNIYFTVTASDAARVYNDATMTSSVAGGNATTTYYRGTTDMLNLINGKKSDFSGFSVLSIEQYLNGTDTTYAGNETLAGYLSSAASKSVVSTDDVSGISSSTSTWLNFSINSKNNPSFTVSGMAIDTTQTGDSYTDGYFNYYENSTINISIAPGLDNDNISTGTVTIYYQDVTANTAKQVYWTWNESVAIAEAKAKAANPSLDDAAAKTLVDTSPATYRYTVTSSTENTDSISKTSSLTNLTAGHNYKFSVSGNDINLQSIESASASGYGFYAKSNASVPNITIGTTNGTVNLANVSVFYAKTYTTTNTLGFSGTVSSSETNGTTKPTMTYDVSIKSPSGTTFTDTANSITVTESASPFKWSFYVYPQDDVTTALNNTTGLYTVIVTISATNGGGTASTTRTYYLDNEKPSIPSLALTNSVEGTLKLSGSSTADVYYINNKSGNTFTLSGTSTDNYMMESTSLTITGLDSSANTKTYTPTAASTISWSFASMDLSGFAAQSGKVDAVATLTAKDKSGNECTKSINLEFDQVNPSWTMGDVNSTTYKLKINADEFSNTNSWDNGWYKDTSLPISGWFSDDGCGVSTVTYTVTPNTGSAYTGTCSVVSSASSIKQFTVTASGFVTGSNKIEFTALDALGNSGKSGEITIKIDSASPTLACDQSGTLLTNKVNDIAVNGTVTDDNSGVSTVALAIGSYTVAAASVTLGASNSKSTTWSTTIPASTILSKLTSTTAVTATVVDAAGNASSSTLFNIAIDTTAPTTTFSSSLSTTGINGIHDLSGTVTEANTATKFSLYYTTTNPATFTAADPATDTTHWTAIPYASSVYAITDSTQIYNWSYTGNYAFNFTSASGIATDSTIYSSKSACTKNIYLLPVITDSAGNCNIYSQALSGSTITKTYSFTNQYKTFIVNQNQDRPIITLSSIDTANSWLQTASLKGTITDDDGISEFKISEDSGTTWTTVPVSDGSWSYSPAADGDHPLYFSVKDSAGTTFITAAANKFNRPFYRYSSTAATEYAYITAGGAYTSTASGNTATGDYGFDATAAIAVRMDTAAPKLSTALVTIATATANLKDIATVAADTTSYTITSSKYVGGNSKYFRVFVPVYDTYAKTCTLTLENSDNEVETVYKDTTTSATITTGVTSLTKTSTTLLKDGNTYTYWMSDCIDASAITADNSGIKTLVFTASDAAGNEKTQSYSISVDNKAPTIAITSPVSATEEVTGSIAVNGTTSDGSGGSGVASVTWFLPTNGSKDSYYSAYTSTASTNQIPTTYADSNFVYGSTSVVNGKKNSTSSLLAWEFDFDGTNNPKISAYVSESLTSSSNCAFASYISSTTNMWYVPIFFRVEDELGNYTVYRGYKLYYNPDGDKPIAKVLYPENVSYATSESHAVVGGSIRASGSATDNESVSAVYMQIAIGSASGSTISYNDYSLSALKTLLDTKSATGVTWSTIDDTKTYRFYDYSASGISSGVSDTSGWWGIKVTSTSSWYRSINTLGELSPSSGINYYKLRVCAVDNNGKAGEWSDPVTLWVDNTAPTITDLSVDYFTSYSLTGTATKSQDYLADMYVKGVWYLSATIGDDTAVTSIEVDDSNGLKMYGVETSGSTASFYSGSSTYISAYNSTINGYKIRIPISPASGTGSTSYKITVSDSDHTTPYTYSFKYDNDAPTVSSLVDSAENKIAMTKLKNTNYVVTFGGSVTDGGSGFDKLAYFFKRTVGSTTTIELPIPGGNASGYYADSSSAAVYKVDSTVTQDTESGLYGVTLSGGTRDSSNTYTFTHASVSSYSFIRKGGLIKIGGVYRTIKSVSGTTVTFDASVGTSYVDAFFPIAFIVDNLNAESGPFSSGKQVISGDDGDGFVESVTKSGTTWTWDSSVMANELDDGPISVCCIAFDAAENTTPLDTSVMISNKAPRLSKVYLATDLNGDGTFTDNELGSSTAGSYYSALNESGGVQQFVTLTDGSSSPVTTGLRMTDKLGVALEFVNGYDATTKVKTDYEGNGSGQGDIYYMLKVGSAALTAPTTTAGGTSTMNGSLTAGSAATYKFDNSASTTTASAYALTGVTFLSSQFKGSTTYGTYTEDGINYLALSLWDSTPGTKQGVADVIDSSTYSDALTHYTSFGSQYTVLNIPVTMDLTDSVKPVPSFDALTKDSAYSETTGSTTTVYGHVEQKDYLPETYFTSSGTTEYDRDDKVSGRFVFTGTVTDETRVSTLSLTCPNLYKTDGTTAVSNLQVAGYTGGVLTTTGYTATGTGWTFAIKSQTFTTTAGHQVTWTLDVDSNKIKNIAAADVVFTLTANDGTNSVAKTYQVDVVPYITNILRSATTYSNIAKTYRSTYGEYPVALGDTLTVTGFNISGVTEATAANNASVGTTKLNTTTTAASLITGAANKLVLTDNTTMSFYVPANSGELTVTVNGITNLNAKNNNAMDNNHDATTTTYYDNCYLRVWDVNHYISNSVNGSKPTLATDNAGNVFSTWTLMGTASVQLQKGLNTTNEPVYLCYDQPDKINALAVDKSKPYGNLSIMYFPANVGFSGTPDSTGYADAQALGGVWGVGVNNTITTGWSNPDSNSKHLKIEGNPYTYVDSKINTAGWQLASASMRREVSLFDQPRTVRYGDNMHFAYYDTKNKALRYTYQPIVSGAEDSGTSDYRYTISGWVLVDGGTDGQDRIHTLKTYDTTGVIGEDTTARTNASVTSLTLKVTGVSGNTLGLAYTDSTGAYKFALRQLTNTTSSQTVTWTEPLNLNGAKITGGCLYYGDSNVVTKGEAISTSAGAYLGMDVTNSGKPVIVYYDADNECMRVAYTSSATPSMTATTTGCGTWTRQYVTDSTGAAISGGTYVQCKIDPNNKLHIMYRDSNGRLCYVVSSNAPDGGNYTFSNPLVIDTTGTFGTLSLIKTTVGATTTYVPCVSFLNSEGTANGVKYAVLRTVDHGTANSSVAKTESIWDTEVVPAVVSNGNHYVTGGELVYVEGYNGWTVTDSVDTSACDAIVGFDTGRMDVVFLKSAK